MLTLHHVSIDSIDLGCLEQVRSEVPFIFVLHAIHICHHASPPFSRYFTLLTATMVLVEGFHAVGQGFSIRTWWWLLGGAVTVRQATEREDGAHMLKVAEFGVACMVAYLI